MALDTEFSRSLLAATLDDVRKMRPGIKTSKANFYVTTMRKGRDQRWMEFEFEGVKTQGYYFNAYEGRTAGWNAWLRANGEK